MQSWGAHIAAFSAKSRSMPVLVYLRSKRIHCVLLIDDVSYGIYEGYCVEIHGNGWAIMTLIGPGNPTTVSTSGTPNTQTTFPSLHCSAPWPQQSNHSQQQAFQVNLIDLQTIIQFGSKLGS